MSLSLSVVSNGQPSKGGWPAIAPYFVPTIAASCAIVPVFRDFVAKSAQQKEKQIPRMTLREGLKEGVKTAPIVGVIVGMQMVFQQVVEKMLMQESDIPDFYSALKSSAAVGTVSAPVLAVFNGQTMGWTVRESLRKFSARQGIAIAVQETAFVGGLSAADRLAAVLRNRFGNNRAVDYAAAFLAGTAGSLAGHPANTALTRWQSGMTIDSFRQLWLGSIRKARAVGSFSAIYKFGKEVLNSTV